MTTAQRTGRPLLLDGPTGTELARRGFDTSGPEWSARANGDRLGLRLLTEIHRDYAAAGAWIHTANTFRTNPTTLRRIGIGDSEGRAWVKAAVAATRQGVDAAVHQGAARWHASWPGSPVVLGSLAPIHDCYTPSAAPDAGSALTEHAAHVKWLEDAGVDGFLVETMNTHAEAVAATTAAARSGRAVLTSFVCARDGRLLSGESLVGAADAVVAAGAAAVLVNCVSTEDATTALRVLRESGLQASVPLGAYPNIGTGTPQDGWRRSGSTSLAGWVSAAEGWLDEGVLVMGGCCGTTAEHTAALASRVWNRQ